MRISKKKAGFLLLLIALFAFNREVSAQNTDTLFQPRYILNKMEKVAG